MRHVATILRRCFFAAVMAGWFCCMTPASGQEVAPEIKPRISPSEFLDNVAQQTKARWRQLFRIPPPTPSTERLRVAFTLGGIVADSFLAMQATDAQQFKNNNQELLSYCKVLGVGEKITPGVLAQSKMGETGDWAAARKQVLETEQLIVKMLNEQKDEDLSILVELGVWARLLEISTSVVLNNDPEVENKIICIGSLKLLDDLKGQFDKLSEPVRADESISRLGAMIDQIQRHWQAAQDHPTNEVVRFSCEKLHFLMDRLTLQ